DDDWASLRLMSAALKVKGHSAVCFADPAEALRAMENLTPAVIVLDVNMPGIDGFELLDRFRAIPRLRNVPVVVWTVRDLSEAERARLLRTTQRIVSKGQGDNDEILDAVESYLDAEGANVR
ncbi:MAG TPA: response regulator, partial [Polyangiaceae bacterium]